MVSRFKCLLLDIGGVVLNNGWDHRARRRAALRFGLNFLDIESRHKLIFETFENGHVSLKEYLDRVIFTKKRDFSAADFRKFMFAQSKPDSKMIILIRGLKAKYKLKVVILSNEGRELNDFRIHKFKLGEIGDFFVSSCFVHLRKPTYEIFKLALNLSQTSASQTIYIENTPMFVEVAGKFKIQSILHTDYRSTKTKLEALGLQFNGGTSVEA